MLYNKHLNLYNSIALPVSSILFRNFWEKFGYSAISLFTLYYKVLFYGL